jgi:hypothetical protein
LKGNDVFSWLKEIGEPVQSKGSAKNLYAVGNAKLRSKGSSRRRRSRTKSRK